MYLRKIKRSWGGKLGGKAEIWGGQMPPRAPL